MHHWLVKREAKSSVTRATCAILGSWGRGGNIPFYSSFSSWKQAGQQDCQGKTVDSALGVNHTWALVLDGQLGEPHDLEQICCLQVADPCL